MARGRFISRSLSTSTKFNLALPRSLKPGLVEFAQLLYTMLLPHVDDFGRCDGDPEAIKFLVLPASRRPFSDFIDALQALNEVSLIRWYTVDGKKYLQIMDFDEHQVGLHKRTKSRFPEFPGISRNPPEIPSEEEVEVEVEGKGREGKSEGKGAPAPPRAPAKGKPEKIHYASSVSMTEQQHADLVAKHGAPAVAWMISKLSDHKTAKGISYKDDAAAIRSWVVDAYAEHQAKAAKSGNGYQPPPPPPNSTCPKCRKPIPAPDSRGSACGRCGIAYTREQLETPPNFPH